MPFIAIKSRESLKHSRRRRKEKKRFPKRRPFSRAGCLQELGTLKRLLDTLPVAVAYLDRNLIFRQCNASAAQTMGRTIDEVIGRHLHEVIPDNPAIWNAADTILRTGEPYPLPTMISPGLTGQN